MGKRKPPRRASEKHEFYRLDLDYTAAGKALQALADETVAALSVQAGMAARSGVEAFDDASGRDFVFSGREAAPMHSEVKATKKGVQIILIVGSGAVKEKYLAITPPLSTDTTGGKRRPVLVSGRRGHEVEVPGGFIWSGRVMRRTGYNAWQFSNITSARPWLVQAGADPSPAHVLAETKEQVIDAVQALLLKAIDDAGKDSK